MAEEQTRVDFNAPESLVNRADSVAEILGISRTRLLIDALEDELDELTNEDEFRRRVRSLGSYILAREVISGLTGGPV